MCSGLARMRNGLFARIAARQLDIERLEAFAARRASVTSTSPPPHATSQHTQRLARMAPGSNQQIRPHQPAAPLRHGIDETQAF